MNKRGLIDSEACLYAPNANKGIGVRMKQNVSMKTVNGNNRMIMGEAYFQELNKHYPELSCEISTVDNTILYKGTVNTITNDKSFQKYIDNKYVDRVKVEMKDNEIVSIVIYPLLDKRNWHDRQMITNRIMKRFSIMETTAVKWTPF